MKVYSSTLPDRALLDISSSESDFIRRLLFSLLTILKQVVYVYMFVFMIALCQNLD